MTRLRSAMANLYTLLFTLLVLGWSTQGRAHSPGEVNWNDVADSLILHAKDEIVTQGKSRIDLPDVRETFTKKKGFIRLKGKFLATGGWLESFSSLERKGEVTLTRQDSASIMTAVLGLSDLRLGYQRYEVDIWGGGPDGTLDGRIGKNAVRFVIKFDDVDGECKTTLEDLQVVELDDFDVKISGLGSFDWLAEKIVESIANKRKDDIKASVEGQLRREMNKALEDFECDEYAALMIPI